MSTLKVNRIEPQSGTTITAIGLTVESASYALTASYALNGGGGTIDTSSFVTAAQTASMTVLSASYAANVQVIDTSSFVTNSQTGSFVTANQTSSFITAEQTSSLSVALSATASYVSGAILNYPDADGTTPTILRMVSMTSASYAALDPKDANTFYVII